MYAKSCEPSCTAECPPTTKIVRCSYVSFASTPRRGSGRLPPSMLTGWSGSKSNRPELNRLLTDARARRFDTVLVWKLDRYGRSIRDTINSIQELVGLGVRFIAVTQNLDTDESNPMAPLHAAHHGRLRGTGTRTHQRARCSGRKGRQGERKAPRQGPGASSGGTRLYGCARTAGRGVGSPPSWGCR